jgi:hypothetical protein
MLRRTRNLLTLLLLLLLLPPLRVTVSPLDAARCNVGG